MVYDAASMYGPMQRNTENRKLQPKNLFVHTGFFYKDCKREM